MALRYTGFLPLALAAIVSAAPACAADDPESFHLEVFGSAWLIDSSGTLHSEGASIDLRSDLGFEQQLPTFAGRLVFKPARKHRIFVEGAPLNGNGLNTVRRSITYHGTVFNVSETLRSNVDLSFLEAGYQYDIVSKPHGHFGLSVSGIYLNGTGTLVTVNTALASTANQKIGLPVAGAEFRVFPIPHHNWIDIDGSFRGMGFGDYGHYVEGNVNGNVWIASHIAIGAGYRRINALLQNSSNQLTGSGLNLNLRGPIYSVGFHW